MTGDLFLQPARCFPDETRDARGAVPRLDRAGTLTVADEKLPCIYSQIRRPAGGITVALLLAESHLAVHPWPERTRRHADVYVCTSPRQLRPSAWLFEHAGGRIPAGPPEREPGSSAATGRDRSRLGRPRPHIAARRTPVASGKIIFELAELERGYGSRQKNARRPAALQSPFSTSR